MNPNFYKGHGGFWLKPFIALNIIIPLAEANGNEQFLFYKLDMIDINSIILSDYCVSLFY